jgi:hypothetical protein
VLNLRLIPNQLACLVIVAAATISDANAEIIRVKYRGSLELSHFVCTTISRSSLVKRVCYDELNRYMVIRLKHTYYHYCEIAPQAVSDLLSAPSIGRHFSQNIRVSSNGGLYDCRKHPVPRYD